jgi:K+-sensing histidine kinase KdpD
VRIWVRDTGDGISVPDQAIIFDRFTRGTDAHRRYPGGGLGLAIVKAIDEAHDVSRGRRREGAEPEPDGRVRPHDPSTPSARSSAAA